MQTSSLVPQWNLWLRFLAIALHQNILQLAPVVVSSWFSFLPGPPSVHSWSIFSSRCRIAFWVLCAAWFCALLGSSCCLGLMLPLPGCPSCSWRLLAAGCCWRPLTAVMLLVERGHKKRGNDHSKSFPRFRSFRHVFLHSFLFSPNSHKIGIWSVSPWKCQNFCLYRTIYRTHKSSRV